MCHVFLKVQLGAFLRDLGTQLGKSLVVCQLNFNGWLHTKNPVETRNFASLRPSFLSWQANSTNAASESDPNL